MKKKASYREARKISMCSFNFIFCSPSSVNHLLTPQINLATPRGRSDHRLGATPLGYKQIKKHVALLKNNNTE